MSLPFDIQSQQDLDATCQDSFVAAAQFYDSLPSTNDLAKNQLRTASEFPRLLLARQQTAGRGRHDRRWLSSDGSLTFSLVFDSSSLERVGYQSSERPAISLLTAIAVCQAIEPLVRPHRVECKWPNDVMLNGQKVAGILLESPAIRPAGIVVGVGINLNNDIPKTSDLSGDTPATNIQDHVGQPVSAQELLGAILDRFDQRWRQYPQAPDELVQQWRSVDFLADQDIEIHRPDGSIASGTAQGVTSSGGLVVRMGSDNQLGGEQRQVFYGGTVRRL